MSTETTEAAPATEAPDAVAVTEAPADTAAAETPSEAPAEAAKTEAEPEAPKPEGKKDWRETRIDQLTREKHEARREADRLRALVEAASKPTEGDSPTKGFVPETEVEKRAAQIAEQREYAAKLDGWAKKGSTEFKDFNERCATVAGLGLAPSERPEFMAIIADMDDGHKLVAHLADHPDAAMSLAKQPAHKMALELAKLSSSLSKPVAVSKAPAPVSAPVGAVATAPDLADPKMSAKEFAALFAKTTKLKGFKG